MSARLRGGVAYLVSLGSVALGTAAAWPIYHTWWLLVPTIAGLLIGGCAAVLSTRKAQSAASSGVAQRRRGRRALHVGGESFGGEPPHSSRLGASVAVLCGGFLLTLVPVTMPQLLTASPAMIARGLVEAVAAVVLGWKQLLTLSLPVGTYQTVLVPWYVLVVVTVFAVLMIAARAGKFAVLAAVPLMFPVAFGTVFGSAAVSTPLLFGSLRLVAPRETAWWLGAMVLAAVWVWFSAGAARRDALHRGMTPRTRSAGRRLLRGGAGAVTAALALGIAVGCAPLLAQGQRQVPRDQLEPLIVLRERASPLAAYRNWKRDELFDTALFTVAADELLPPRLRLVVLDTYDGVDFHIGQSEVDRFSRFPSAEQLNDSTQVTVTVAEGYNDIWLPTAPLGSVPSFDGSRAADLMAALYVNRESGAAIVVPGGSATEGLQPGDRFTAVMDTATDGQLLGDPASNAPDFDFEAMPELSAWLRAQQQPNSAAGLMELIKRLRERGYLSHSLSDGDGHHRWIEQLTQRYGTQFEAAAGGHSVARIELLFEQLNTQQRLAGSEATDAALVAAIGDDEQFATAAALLARALGFDARVVLGVRLGDEQQGVPGVAACEGECRGEHLAAWVEVRGEQAKWVPIDVTPQVTLRPTLLEQGEQLPEFSTIPDERDAPEVDPPIGLGERSDAAEQSTEMTAESWWLSMLRQVAFGAAALIMLLTPFLFLPLAKRMRAKKRRIERDAELRALGAWQELVDRALDAGLSVSPKASRSRVAVRIGTESARKVAELADRAVFSAGGPTEQEARAAWSAVDQAWREQQAQRTRLQRLRVRYSLASYGVSIARLWGDRAESAMMPEHIKPGDGKGQA